MEQNFMPQNSILTNQTLTQIYVYTYTNRYTHLSIHFDPIMEGIFIRNNDCTFVVVTDDAIAKENSVSHINNTYKAKSHDFF